MRIERVETFPVSVPRSVPYITPHSRQDDVKAVIVRLTTDEGITGIGEAFGTPPSYIHENPLTMKLMIDRYYGPALQGEDPGELERLVEKIEHTWVGFPFSKAALEMALYDCLAKKHGLSVCHLLGGVYRREVPLIEMVFPKDPEEMAEEAVRAVQRGFTTLKLKVGANPSLDVERIRLIREAVGPDIKLRVDVNHGYTVNQAVSFIRRVEAYDLVCVEDPVEEWNVEGIIYVSQKVGVPICFDYNAITLHETFRLLATKGPRMVKIKLGKVGGYRTAKGIIAMCEAAGVPVILGNAKNLSVHAYAEIQLFCSSRWLEPAGEMIGPLKMVDDIVDVPLQVNRGKTMLPERPGLGVLLDEDKMMKYKAVA